MTKLEKIQEEWEKIGVKLEPVEGDTFGWRANHNAKYDTWDGRFEVNNFFHRPKSLQGIESNNGWIKIESDDDLPKEDLQCWLIDEEFGTDIGYFSSLTKKWFVDCEQFPTHYQPIKKPNPPIY